MDELELLIQAILSLKDTTKSKQQILSELPKLEQQLQSDKNARVNIVAGLDIKKSKSLIQSQLNTLASQAKAPTIKVGVDVTQCNTQNTIVNGLKNIQTQANASASSIKQIKSELLKLDTTDVKNTSFKMGFDKDMVFNLEKTLSNAKNVLSKFGEVGLDWRFEDSGQIDKITAKITDATGVTEQFAFKLNEASETFSFFGGSGSTSGVDKVIESEKKLDSQIKATTTSLNQQLYNIKSNATMGSSPIKTLEFEDGGRLKEQVDNVKNSIEALQSADKITMESMETNANAQISKLQQMIKEIQNAEYAATSLRKKGVINVKNTQTDELNTFINQINNSKVCLKDFDSETGNTIENLKKSLNSITDTKSLTDFLNQFDEAKSKFKSLESFYKGIGQYDKELDKLTNSWKKQGVYTDELKITIDELRNSLKNIATGDTGGMSKWVENYNKAMSKINVDPERQKQLTKNLNEQISLQNQILQKQKEIVNIENKPYNTSKLSELNKIVAKKTEELNKLQQESATMTDLMSIEKQRQYILDNTSKTQEELAIAEKNALDTQQRSYELTQKKADALEAQIKTYETINTKASKVYKSEFDSLKNDLEAAKTFGSPEEIDKIRARFTSLKSEIKIAGKEGQTFFQKMIDGAKKFSSWMSLTTIISTLVRDIRKMVTTVIELDTALIDLKKTFTGTEQDLVKFYKSANETAKQLGVTTKEIIEQASAWSRLGYSSASAAEDMAKYSAIFKTISPGMDMDSATDGLVSMMKAYGIEVNDVLDGIMSKVNIIGNKFATSNSDIVDAMTRSSSALAAANNTLDESIALNTASIEITRNAERTATAWKTVSMRLRGYDEEAEELSDDLVNISGDIADLTKTASNSQGISIFTDESRETYKSTYNIIKEISEIWDDLSDKNQAELLEKIGGKLNAQVVAAAIKNFKTAESAMEEMANSQGNAMEEMEIAYESVSYKINEFKETFVGIAQDDVTQDFLKSMIDSGIRLLETFSDASPILQNLLNIISGGVTGVTAFIKQIGLIPTIFTGLSLKNVGELNQNTPSYATLLYCA